MVTEEGIDVIDINSPLDNTKDKCPGMMIDRAIVRLKGIFGSIRGGDDGVEVKLNVFRTNQGGG